MQNEANLDLNLIYDARQYVRHWFVINDTSAKDAVRKPTLFNTLFLDYKQLIRVAAIKNASKIRGLIKDELQCAFDEYVEVSLDEERKAEFAQFIGHPENLEPLRTWVKAVTGTVEDKNVAVMAHWLWSVKRKASDKRVKYNIMPILRGIQGSGKSWAIGEMIKPLAEFKMNMKMQQLGDERVYEGLSQNLIVFFDELEGIERTDLNALKNQVTTDTNSYRKLHSHSVVLVPMRCSFIGASNKPLNESFSDSTGMRRFWEIESLPKTDWAAVNSLDYVALWQGIDETKENGYLDGNILADVLQAQQVLVNKDDIETFVDDLNVAGDGAKTVSANQMFQTYREWCEEKGVRSPLNFMWFNRKLINKDGVQSYIDRDDRKHNIRYYKVDSKSTIGAKKELKLV